MLIMLMSPHLVVFRVWHGVSDDFLSLRYFKLLGPSGVQKASTWKSDGLLQGSARLDGSGMLEKESLDVDLRFVHV